MKIKKQIIKGGKQQFADKIENFSQAKTPEPNAISKSKSKKDLKKLFEDNKLEELFLYLNSFENLSKELSGKLVIIQNRIKHLELERNEALITNEEYLVYRTKILASILSILESL